MLIAFSGVAGAPLVRPPPGPLVSLPVPSSPGRRLRGGGTGGTLRRPLAAGGGRCLPPAAGLFPTWAIRLKDPGEARWWPRLPLGAILPLVTARFPQRVFEASVWQGSGWPPPEGHRWQRGSSAQGGAGAAPASSDQGAKRKSPCFSLAMPSMSSGLVQT